MKTAVVSLGDYRRKVLGGSGSLPADYFTLGESLPILPPSLSLSLCRLEKWI